MRYLRMLSDPSYEHLNLDYWSKNIVCLNSMNIDFFNLSYQVIEKYNQPKVDIRYIFSIECY